MKKYVLIKKMFLIMELEHSDSPEKKKFLVHHSVKKVILIVF